MGKIPRWFFRRLLCVFITLATNATAEAQTGPSIGTVTMQRQGHTAIEADGLYRVDLNCVQKPMQIDGSIFDINIFANPITTATGVITISNDRIDISNAPPPASIVAAIPFENRSLSRDHNSDKGRHNLTCGRSFLINGHNNWVITVTYSESVAQQPSKILTIVSALAGITKPLLNAVPGGPAAGPAIEAIAGASSAYSPLLSAFNEAGSIPWTDYLKAGNYSIETPTAHVNMSVTKIDSLLKSATPQILTAFDSRIDTLEDDIKKDQTSCVSKGTDMEQKENYAHSDVVDAMSKAVFRAGLNLATVEACLKTAYGPAVVKTVFWKKNVAIDSDTYDFPPVYDRMVSYNRLRLDDLRSVLKAYYDGRDPKDISEYFESSLYIKDGAGVLKTTDNDINSLLMDLKSSSFTLFGCPYDPKDEGYFDEKHRPASAMLIATKSDPIKPPNFGLQEAVLITLWWEGAVSTPKVFEVRISNPEDMLRKIISNAWTSECSANQHFDIPKPPG